MTVLIDQVAGSASTQVRPRLFLAELHTIGDRVGTLEGWVALLRPLHNHIRPGSAGATEFDDPSAPASIDHGTPAPAHTPTPIPMRAPAEAIAARSVPELFISTRRRARELCWDQPQHPTILWSYRGGPGPWSELYRHHNLAALREASDTAEPPPNRTPGHDTDRSSARPPSQRSPDGRR